MLRGSRWDTTFEVFLGQNASLLESRCECTDYVPAGKANLSMDRRTV